MTLKNIKVGDTVFVVEQNTRDEAGKQRESSTEVVTKVGRKYGYIGERKFELATGESWEHVDSNDRINGFGFDVFLSESEYQDSLVAQQSDVDETSEAGRLYRRLMSTGIVGLNPTAVKMIHEILDMTEGK